MRINKIVLDLDDTLNSLTMHILNRLGCGVGPFEYEEYPVECGYDIIQAYCVLSDHNPEDIDVPMFWEWVSRRIWEECPRSHEYWLVEHAAQLVGKENVMIATVPTKSADCHFGKYQWISRHLPEWINRQYSITPRKEWLAQPGVMLIDDSDNNIAKFTDRKRGGAGIVCPRPWNSQAGTHTSCYIAEQLGKYEYVRS